MGGGTAIVSTDVKVAAEFVENSDGELERAQQEIHDVMPTYGAFGWLRVPHLVKLNLLLMTCMLSSTSNGYDGSLLNGLQSMPKWQEAMGKPTGQHLGGLSNGFMFGGIACWPLLPYAADRLGRKWTIAMGCAIIIVGSAIQAAANNYTCFLVGRLVLGFGSGFATGASPLLLIESSYPEQRQVVTSIYNTLWYLGSIIAAWLCLGSSFLANSSWSWRIPSLMQGFLPLLQLLMAWWVPESPRFFIERGRYKEARAMLVKWHAGGDETSKLVDFEMAEIATTIELEKSFKAGYMDFFKTRANRYRLFLVCIVPCNMQLSGNGLVSYYLNIVLTQIGITNAHQQLYFNGGLQISNFIWAVGAALVVEKFGRRPMFMTSFIGMLVTYVIWTVLSAIGLEQTPQFSNKNLSNGVLGMIFVYYFFYGIALNGMPVLYYTEIMPYYLRAKAVNVAGIVTTLTLIYNGFVNPVAMQAITWKYYIVWDALLLCWLIIAYFFYPETKGRTLEQIGEVFGEETVRVTAATGEVIGREKEVFV